MREKVTIISLLTLLVMITIFPVAGSGANNLENGNVGAYMGMIFQKWQQAQKTGIKFNLGQFSETVSLYADGRAFTQKMAKAGYQAQRVGIFLEFDGFVPETKLENLGMQVNPIGGGFATARATIDQIDALLGTQSLKRQLERMEVAPKVDLYLNESVPNTGAEDIHTNNDPTFQGDGVLVGVVDTGIDYDHLDFRFDSDGNGSEESSRIAYLWDQTDTSNPSPPSGFQNGTEYTRSDIEDDISNGDGPNSGTVNEVDEEGHGTHVAGIAAGDGSSSNAGYVGMAPLADIIGVKLDWPRRLEQYGADGVVNAVEYIFQKAEDENKDAVVNLSLGIHLGPHDGTSQFARQLSQLVEPGHIIVAAAGNEGWSQDPIHVGADIDSGGRGEVTFNVNSASSGRVVLDFWLSGDDEFAIALTTPNGISVGSRRGGTRDRQTNDGRVIISHTGVNSTNGDRQVVIRLNGTGTRNNTGNNDVAAGEWTLTIENLQGTGGKASFDGWFAARTPRVRFTSNNANTDMTIAIPGTSPNVITVGSHNTKQTWTDINGNQASYINRLWTGDGSLSFFSSKGPTRQSSNGQGGLTKPNITAPGMGIASSLAADNIRNLQNSNYNGMIQNGVAGTQDGNHYVNQGTSMSAPHVTGAVALILQSTVHERPSTIKNLLEVNASNSGTSGALPNNEWGWGKLSLTNIIPEFEIISPSKNNEKNVGPKDNPRKIDVLVKWQFNGLIKKDDFTVKIGGKQADVIQFTPEGLTGSRYRLKIEPPVQGANDVYDLKVKLDEPEVNKKITDTEEDSIRYSAGANVDVPLVLDRSGSMGGQKIKEARSAATQFVSLMDTGDMIGVVSFATNATQNYSLTEITSQNIKDQAQNAINNISSGGATSIGDGLHEGQNQLDSNGNSSHDHAIVLMSDGWENEPRYVSDVLPGIPDKTDVYTVAFGSSPDESLLEHIAEETGGKYYRTHENRDISDIYNRIAAVATGQQTITSKSGTVNENETSTIDTVVDSTVTEASFVLGWSGSNLDLTLEDPSGNTIDPNSASSDPDISYSSGSTFETYIVESPNSGDWKMQVEGVSTSSGGEPYSANVTADSDLTFDTNFGKSQYTEGQPITVLASLSEGTKPLTGVNVSVTVQPPAQSTSSWKTINGDTMPSEGREVVEEELAAAASNSTTQLTLYDDGQHGDGQANDGVYGNYYQQTTKSGSYIFKFDASGATTQGDDFTRTAQRSTFVEQASASGSVEGEVSYAGKESGEIYINAWVGDSTLSGNPGYQTSISSPNSYKLGGLPDGVYYIQTFMDTNGNGTNDAEDPTGIYGGASPDPVQISGGSAKTGIDIELCGSIVSTSLPKGYNLFSIPGRSHDFDPEEALGDEISSLYMYRWNPEKDEYDETSDLQLDLGFGSWLWVWDEDTQVELEVCVPPGESSTTLPDDGWHIVGAPFPIKWGEVKVNGTKIKNETSGSNYSGPLKPYIFPYDEADNEYDLAQPSSWTDLGLNRWDGYWIQTTQPDVKLSFDKKDSSSTSASPSVLRSGNQNILVAAKGKGVSLPPAPPIQPLQGEGLQVVASPSLVKGSGEVTFTVWSEQPVEGLQVEVLAPNGQKVWNEKTNGSKLNWDTKGVPNGIYLYTASAKVDGELQQAGIGKLLVLK